MSTWLHWGDWQGRGRKEDDLSDEKTVVEGQPTQPEQGIQAASLLVSRARRRVWAGVPILARTTKVGLWISCRAEAMGTTDLRATREDRNWRRAWSLACIWSTLSAQERGFEGRNGEQGLKMWNTLRVELRSSAGLQLRGIWDLAVEMENRRRRRRRRGRGRKGDFVLFMASFESERCWK